MATLGTAVRVPRLSLLARRARHADRILLGAAAVCALLVIGAALAPLIAPSSPSQTDILAASQGPSGAHLLGTDSLGRDVFSRVVYGARLSLLGAGLVVVGATALGTALAILAVWCGGLVDRALARTMDLMFAFPSLLFALLSVAIFGSGLTAPVVALSIAYTPYVARVVRSVAYRQRHLPYVEAGQMLGLSAWRICAKHIFPNVRHVVRAQATTTFGSALIDLAAVSFLGLGVQPPTAEWGLMVADGRADLLNGHAWPSLSAGVMIIVTVVAFNTLGERLAPAEARR